jgi:Matrixin
MVQSRTRGRLRTLAASTLLSASFLVISAGSAGAAPPFDFPCTANTGWDHAPTVGIDTDGAPSPGGVNASILVQDAIGEYWNEGASVDGVADNGAASAFKGPGPGFGAVTAGATPGNREIDITFTSSLPAGVLGQATCTINSGEIIGATVELVSDDPSLSAEDYKNIAAHELGHTIGLQHKGPAGTMMHKFFFDGLDAYLPLAGASKRWLNRNY